MAECGEVNPQIRSEAPKVDRCLYSRTVPAAQAAKLVPNVLRIPIDYISEAERVISATGHPRISIHSAQACALERSRQYRCSNNNTAREMAVTSYKPRVDWRKLGRYGLSPTMGGIIVSHWATNTCLKLGSPQSVRC